MLFDKRAGIRKTTSLQNLATFRNGSMTGKEIQFFFLSEISIYLSSFVFLYINDFLMV